MARAGGVGRISDGTASGLLRWSEGEEIIGEGERSRWRGSTPGAIAQKPRAPRAKQLRREALRLADGAWHSPAANTSWVGEGGLC